MSEDNVQQEYKDFLFGDDFFNNCVRIVSVLDGSYVLPNGEEQSAEKGDEVLGSSFIPQCVIEYAASCAPSYRRLTLLNGRRFSDRYVIEHLKRILEDEEQNITAAHRMLTNRSNYLRDVMECLKPYKLFADYEKLLDYKNGVRATHPTTQQVYVSRYERSKVAEHLGVDALLLGELATCSTNPLQVLEECVGFDADPAVLAFLFFNKHLTMDEVQVLLEEMSLSCGENVEELRHLLLFKIVLLREDWTADEMRFLYEAWLKFVKKIEVGLNALMPYEFHAMLPPSVMLANFQALVPEVDLMFATNEAMPCDLLLKLFLNGNSKVRAAVVRNPGVGQKFAQAVLDGDANAVSDAVSEFYSVSLVEDDVCELREHVVWNPVLSFSELEKIYNDENETVPVRFGALFNENVPSFVRALYW